ncbi:MAG: peroxide stress protein YaaA [Castellaniella sp.]
MLIVLSPAKKLDYDTPVRTTLDSEPCFLDEAAALIDVLRPLGRSELARLMKLSDALAGLNVERYQAWTADTDPSRARQAVLAFNGDVYEGLDAASLSDAQLQWAQAHVAILSGLYGVLRPLDRIQPHRLEMGTRLATARGTNLYQWWGATIAEHLNRRLDAVQDGSERVLVNLASVEYFKAVDQSVLDARVVQCVFEDFSKGQWKVISFHAKRARGLMARAIIEERMTAPAAMQGFSSDGYAWAPEVSTPDRMVFRRAAR